MKTGPEVPPIFAGQRFFFVPNDRRAVPRKRRIDKAVLHGSTWAEAWTSSVTYVIVEGDQTMADVAKATGQEELPANIFLVSDTWLTESLSYKEMRYNTARRFRLERASEVVVEAYIQEDSRQGHASTPSTEEEFSEGELTS
jgi:hypothetical protein